MDQGSQINFPPFSDEFEEMFLSTFSIPEVGTPMSPARQVCVTDPSILNAAIKKAVPQDQLQHRPPTVGNQITVTQHQPTTAGNQIVVTQHQPTSDGSQFLLTQLQQQHKPPTDGNRSNAIDFEYIDEILAISGQAVTEPPPVILKENPATESPVQPTTIISLTPAPLICVPSDSSNTNLLPEDVNLPSSSTSNNERPQTTNKYNEDGIRWWQRTEKCSDPEDEKRRINAIKARNNRQNRKKEVQQLNEKLSNAKKEIAEVVEERDKLMKTVTEQQKKHNMQVTEQQRKHSEELMKERNEKQILQNNFKMLLSHIIRGNPNIISNKRALVSGNGNSPIQVRIVQNQVQQPSIVTGTQYIQSDQNLLPGYNTTVDAAGAIQSNQSQAQIWQGSGINGVQSNITLQNSVGNGSVQSTFARNGSGVTVPANGDLLQSSSVIGNAQIQVGDMPFQLSEYVDSTTNCTEKGQVFL